MLLNFISIVVSLLSFSEIFTNLVIAQKISFLEPIIDLACPPQLQKPFVFWDCKTCSCLVCMAFLPQTEPGFLSMIYKAY